MRDRELYAKILGMTNPWEVEDVELDLEEHQVTVHVRYRTSARTPCPTCGADCPRYDSRERSWRHLDTMQYRTYLTTEVPRVKCTEHGVLQMKVPWGEERSRFTALFESLVIDWLHEASITAVARLLGLSWDEVAGIQARAVERGLARRKLKAPRKLGVDETSFQTRHEYVTVVCDLEQSRVLYVADHRKEESLAGFFDMLSPVERSAVQAVAMDMHGPYIRATQKALPNADELISFDRFHVAKHFGDAVDKVRREEHRELLQEGDDRLKNTKYLWLKSSDSMDSQTWADFAPLRTSSLRVARAYAIKEVASCLWYYKRRSIAEANWRQLLGWMQRSRLHLIIKVGRTVRAHFHGIMNAVISGITNARTEAINSRIQWIKKQACGFRNRERFRNAIYFHLGGLDLYPRPSN
jgi:transposase